MEVVNNPYDAILNSNSFLLYQLFCSLFLCSAVIVAKATEPRLDQLIPLSFWRLETIRSLLFSPLLLELRKPNSFRKA